MTLEKRWQWIEFVLRSTLAQHHDPLQTKAIERPSKFHWPTCAANLDFGFNPEDPTNEAAFSLTDLIPTRRGSAPD